MKQLLLLFCVFIASTSSAQNNNTDYNAAIHKLQAKAVAVAKQEQDSAYFYLKTSIALSTQEKQWDHVMDAYFETYNIAFFHNNLDQRKGTLHTIDSLYQKQIDYFKKTDLSLRYHNHINYYYAFHYFRLNNYKLAKKHFQNIIDATENNADTIIKLNKSFLSVSYSYIAKMHTDEGQYALSKALYQKNIRLIKRIDSTNQDLLFSNFNLLAEVLKKEKKHKASNAYFLKSFRYYSAKDSPNTIMSSCFNIAENYIALSKIDSARFYLKHAKAYLDENHIYNTNYHELYSKIYSKENNYPEALTELQQLISFYKNKADRTTNKSLHLANGYKKIGALQLKFNTPVPALKHLDSAITLFTSDTIKSSINAIHLLTTLQLKADGLNRVSSYESTIKTVDFAITILDEIRPEFRNNTDKLFLIENAYPLYETGLQAAFALYSKHNDNHYIDKAFKYAEKSKSALLLEGLLSAKATEYANIPESVIEEEYHIKNNITALEKKLNTNRSESLEDELFNLKNTHRVFIERLEGKFPEYYNLKYNSQTLSIEGTQHMLKANTMLISYFYGEHAIYTLAISKNKKQFLKKPLSAEFTATINTAFRMLGDPKSEVIELKKRLISLHESIIKPINHLESQIIISPDGVLNYIPFAALVDENSEFLISKHAISYINSATLLQELQRKKENNGHMLAFAPAFNDNTKLLPLPNTIKEAENCLIHFKGELLIQDKASLLNFQAKSGNYSILHLATHAVFNDSSPEFSYLAFTPSVSSPYLLYTKDLYNLKLNADLVTLSACESGMGTLHRGEGLMSLARGFYFSGSNAIMSTLWKINDNSTAVVMDHFYSNLSKRHSKSHALQKAQLSFLKANKDTPLSHPYYWSAFIISGHTEALQTPTNYNLYILAITTILLLLLFIKFRKKLT